MDPGRIAELERERDRAERLELDLVLATRERDDARRQVAERDAWVAALREALEAQEGFEAGVDAHSRIPEALSPRHASPTGAEERMNHALRQIVAVLGPNTAGCSENTCQGCRFEMQEALRIAKEAIDET